MNDTTIKLILEVLRFLLVREISRLKMDSSGQAKNLMDASFLQGRIDHAIEEMRHTVLDAFGEW